MGTQGVKSKPGIYVVESPRGERPRTVVIADNARLACDLVGQRIGMSPREIDDLNVGRLGDYDPGMTGASFLCDGSRPANVVSDDGIAAEYI